MSIYTHEGKTTTSEGLYGMPRAAQETVGHDRWDCCRRLWHYYFDDTTQSSPSPTSPFSSSLIHTTTNMAKYTPLEAQYKTGQGNDKSTEQTNRAKQKRPRRHVKTPRRRTATIFLHNCKITTPMRVKPPQEKKIKRARGRLGVPVCLINRLDEVAGMGSRSAFQEPLPVFPGILGIPSVA